ncbi:MAG: hypothetical protein J5671_02935 [Bacteroidaceae bacterium]|nr:hypothetical protein [Bacteroidaceae bacterium]
MKRNYIKPESSVVFIQMEKMVAESTLGRNSGEAAPVSGDDYQSLVHADNSWNIWGSGDDWDE